MKNILYKLFSIQVLGMLALIFAFAIAVATFIEYYAGTDVAWYFIYDAVWFEIMLAYISVGAVVNVFAAKLYKKGKRGIMVFHLAIAVMIIGAGITRFVGQVGSIQIRENTSSDVLMLNDTEVSIRLFKDSLLVYKMNKVVTPNSYNQNYFDEKYQNVDHNLEVKSVAFTKTGMRLPVSRFIVNYNGLSEDVYAFHSKEATAGEAQFGDVRVDVAVGNRVVHLPFKLYLDSFVMERYPGSKSPSSYSSYVQVIDNAKEQNKSFDIYMNHILKYQGYRFFQSSYDDDEKGTILSVNHDPWGTTVTYVGYFLLILGMLKALTDKRSRFKKHLGSVRRAGSSAVLIFMMLFLAQFTRAETHKASAEAFGKLWVQTNDGRIKPVNSFAGDLLRKMSRRGSEEHMSAQEIVLEILQNPASAADKALLYKSVTGIPKIDNVKGRRIAYNSLFDTQGVYVLAEYVDHIYKKQPGERSKSENNILALDERVNIFNMLRNGRLMNLFPKPGDASAEWVDLRLAATTFTGDSSIQKAFVGFYDNFFSRDPEAFNEAVVFIEGWQTEFGASVLPSQSKRKVELLYNKLNVFERLSVFYGIISFIFLISAIIELVSRNKIAMWVSRVMGIHLIVATLIHGFGLLLRGIISEHMPLSNGYETMIFVAWICLLIGIYFAKKSHLTFALLGLLAASAMMVAHLSFMNPQITPLVPVLKSVWLTIHVTVITSSYAFLGGCFIIALATLMFMIFANKNNATRTAAIVRQLIAINRMILIPGLYLLTIGCFLGAIWANQSWGKYWGWDPKETWCLISVLIYSLVAHLHHLPGLKGSFYYVAGSLVAFASILMTYFGVNYFLGGMHSYAGDGDVSGLPTWAYMTVLALVAILIIASNRFKRILSPKMC